jgi:hypothetical protein
MKIGETRDSAAWLCINGGIFGDVTVLDWALLVPGNYNGTWVGKLLGCSQEARPMRHMIVVHEEHKTLAEGPGFVLVACTSQRVSNDGHTRFHIGRPAVVVAQFADETGYTIYTSKVYHMATLVEAQTAWLTDCRQRIVACAAQGLPLASAKLNTDILRLMNPLAQFKAELLPAGAATC